MLARHRQRLPAGGDHPYARRRLQHVGHELAGCSQQVLAVVHDQQQFLVLQVRKQESQRLGRGLVPEVQGRHGGVAHGIRVQDFSELNQRSAVTETASEVCRDPDRQACLADPARPRQGDQAGMGKLLSDFREFAAAADEAGRLSREVARSPGGPSHNTYIHCRRGLPRRSHRFVRCLAGNFADAGVAGAPLAWRTWLMNCRYGE